MADIVVKNLTGNYLAVAAPVNATLKMFESRRISGVDLSALNNATAVQDFVRRGWISIIYTQDPTVMRLQDVTPTADVLKQIVTSSDQPTAYVRQGAAYKLLLDQNVQMNGVSLLALTIGGVVQPTAALVWPDHVTVTIDPATPLGACGLKMIVDGRQMASGVVVVYPPTGVLPPT